jgi:hypothetical protein
MLVLVLERVADMDVCVSSVRKEGREIIEILMLREGIYQLKSGRGRSSGDR